MIRKTTIILVIIFALLVILLVYSGKTSIGFLGTTPTATQAIKLIDNQEGAGITEITLESLSRPTQRIIKDANGIWFFASDSELMLNQSKINELISMLMLVDIKTLIEDQQPLEPLGLSDPYYEITLLNKDSIENKIKVGDVTPTSSGYYVQVNENNPAVIAKMSGDYIIDLISGNALVDITPTAPISVFGTPQSP